MRDEVFDLLTRGVAQRLDTAKVGRIRLDQVWIESVLPDDLAESVANFRAAMFPLPLAGCGGSFLDSGEACGGSAKDPISSTEQMPIP